MPHQHNYHLNADVVLTLPDTEGYRDKLLLWTCACGRFELVTGSFAVHGAPVTLQSLTARVSQERQAGGVLARVAQREEQVRIGRRARR